MADPRFTIRQCYPPYAGRSAGGIASKAQDSNNFYRALGKVGDLEILNDLKLGKIGKGLRVLAGVSNTVKSGCGVLPSSIAKSIEAGGTWVMDTLGIAQDVVDAVNKFNPNVANAALGQAKSIYTRVKQGNFRIQDIPGVVQDFINLEQLAQNIFSPSSWHDARRGLPTICEYSPYAVDLARNANVPKFKFLFVVQFVLNDGYTELAQSAAQTAFVVKNVSRPSVKYETEEVNYYNFRTQAITKVTFDDVKMTFHDAGGPGNAGNGVTNFIHSYLRAFSPIANIGPDGSRMFNLENRGMDFASGYYSGSRGALLNEQVQIIREIMIYHVYDYGNYVNVYHYFNPRITMISEDDLDMAVGDELSSVEMSFKYDSVYVEEAVPFSDIEARMMDAQGSAQFKIFNGTTKERASSYNPPQQPSKPNESSCGITSPSKSPASNLFDGALSKVKNTLSSLF